MRISYAVRVVLENGDWGYAVVGHELTKELVNAASFDSQAEAEDWYYRYVKGTYYNGVGVDGPRCTITSFEDYRYYGS